MSCQTGVGSSTSIMYRLLKPICLFTDLWHFGHAKIRQCLFTIQPAFIVSKEILNSVDCKYYYYLVRHFIGAFIDKKTELIDVNQTSKMKHLAFQSFGWHELP